MSRRREIDARLAALDDIGNVMGAMKNLALMEMHKLGRRIPPQRRAVQSIEEAAADLVGSFPGLIETPRRIVYLAVGSERGFCGDFNEAVAAALRSQETGPARVVAVGRRLWSKLELSPDALSCLDGPSVAEEVEGTLGRLMRALASDGAGMRGAASLTVLHHRSGETGVSVSQFAPFSPALAPARRGAYPPALHVPPQSLLPELVKQYLFAALSAILYDSLLAESSRRLQHMDNALRRIDTRRAELRLKRNFLRQEEITEEIELIMLSADASGPVQDGLAGGHRVR